MSGPGDSYATITVPEGDPGAIEHAGGQFGHLAHQLAGVSRELHGMPGSLTSWSGPASVTYAGSCMTNGASCERAVQAFGEAQRAAHAYAHALRTAQHDAEQAIDDARDAQRRIDAANRAIADAQSRASAAGLAMSAAAHRIATASATGVADPGAHADHDRASGELSTAQEDEARARRELDRAQDDLRRAKRRGHRAMDAAREAAGTAAGAFGAATGTAPAVYFGPSAQAQPGSGSRPAWDWDTFWGGLDPFYSSNDTYARYKWFGDQGMGWAFEGAKDAAIAYGLRLGRNAITDTTVTTITHTVEEIPIRPGVSVITSSTETASRTTTVIDADMLAKAASWGKVGKAVPVVGTIAGMASSGYDQWRADASNPNLTTTDRVGRAAGVGVYVGGAAAAGAAIGTMLFPGVGTLAGAGIGAVGGLVAGAAASAWQPGKEFAADVGSHIANGAVDAYHWTGDRLADVGHGLDQAKDWAGDKVSDVGHDLDEAKDWVGDHLPDLNPF